MKDHEILAAFRKAVDAGETYPVAVAARALGLSVRRVQRVAIRSGYGQPVHARVADGSCRIVDKGQIDAVVAARQLAADTIVGSLIPQTAPPATPGD